ncbi:aldo/keto reductase [Kerstersia gyiorum]|uniref:aldo/keto reductase n=1 Tax=Kerstersia gyiorum TaxID=206506 RepID=UPI00209E9288|nr:aldo/keto reductase [Kerstersia gyiorum]MCP1633849.1 aryl-alcohol dehydrogenase-like predicted oxidoreductase [Kerstersia gyiorum]MCP1683007.1 aryl-alcohol dehydrogenase-like predicted oxidoreductase [Kerstersia gyiorum]MCP1718755.1 aryl-alcohol dehydrogenase-like predicted oxidoreductase [Kerstersia gyiorum]MCW2187692.1 aryl-alcohol dehydrogenase-like predicted oxidoreductase [Kerstersia gyiorum]
MQQRKIGSSSTSAIGLGCMNLSHAYGSPPGREVAEQVVRASLDEGVTFFDTAALYGFGANETLMGELLAPHRKDIFLASKCGMTGVDGKRVIDGRPETLKATCDASLQRLRTDVIDLYYLHRWDKNVPIEDSIGALADLVQAGKIRAIGLSEVSAATLRKAHAVHPIAAVQTEYSLWTRNAEIAVLQACRELGAAFVAFSPVARGYLGGGLRDVTALEPKDIRRGMPRFAPENYARNLELLEPYLEIADELEITPAQLALAWLLAQDDHIFAIPGTTNPQHARDNAQAADIKLDATVLAQLDELINQETVVGPRYPAATQVEIDTEEF